MATHERRQLPVRLELAPAESGLGFTLRALRANGIGFDHGMRWLGLERHRPLDQQAVLRVAWALNVDAAQFGARMVTRDVGGGNGWVRLAGTRFRRQVATNKRYAKLCPQCIRERGVMQLSWQLRAAVGCSRHGYSLIWACPHCGEAIGWDRPDVDICRCGRYFKGHATAAMEPSVHAWLCWLESALCPETVQAVPATLPRALTHLSIDGAFRIIEALGLRDTPGISVRTAVSKCKTPRALGAVLHCGLERLQCIEADAAAVVRIADVANQPALVQVAADAATKEDEALAWWLLQGMRSSVDPGSTRAGSRPKGQLPLFIT